MSERTKKRTPSSVFFFLSRRRRRRSTTTRRRRASALFFNRFFLLLCGGGLTSSNDLFYPLSLFCACELQKRESAFTFRAARTGAFPFLCSPRASSSSSPRDDDVRDDVFRRKSARAFFVSQKFFSPAFVRFFPLVCVKERRRSLFLFFFDREVRGARASDANERCADSRDFREVLRLR